MTKKVTDKLTKTSKQTKYLKMIVWVVYSNSSRFMFSLEFNLF